MKKIQMYFFIAILTGICMSPKGFAQTFEHRVRDNYNPAVLHATDIANKVSISQPCTLDHEGFFWTDLDQNTSPNYIGHMKAKVVRANIRLYVDHWGGLQTGGVPNIWDAYTYRVLINVKGYTVPGDANTFTTFTDTLTISYTPDTIYAYQDINLHAYSGFYKIQVEVIDIYDWTGFNTTTFTPPTQGFIGGNNMNAMAKNWYIETYIEEQKFDKDLKDGSQWKSAMAAATLNIAATAPQSGDNHLLVNWDIVTGDEPSPALYELEWAYVDNYNVKFETTTSGDKVSQPTVTNIGPSDQGFSDLQYSFRNNTTRIITDKPEYKIPLVYKQGYLVFRVRLIRPDETNYRHNVYSAWTITSESGALSTLTSLTHYYHINSTNAHLGDDYNWNYQATYAEEGKAKNVVTYYDGLLKQRQTITKLNTLPDQQVVAQTYYNYEGKPGLQTLPIPVQQQSLAYVDDFAYPSGSSTAGTYKPSDIDNISPSPLTALDNGSPADGYYSSANSFLGNNIFKAIPDAEGYPLVHTKFAPEDGRVISQGGAGQELQLGMGHETRNYFLPATQFELDKYFGFDVGVSTFYEKTITKDPNQQLSFSIANNKGQTVMSGLMGYPASPATSPLVMPDDITLPSGDASHFPSTDVLYGNKYIWSGNNRKYSVPHFMEKAGNVLFAHNISLSPLSVCSSGGQSYYLNVPITYSVKLISDYGIPQVLKSETLGTGVTALKASTPPAAHSATNSTLTATGVSIGKNTIEYDVSYNPEDVKKAVEQLFPMTGSTPYPECITPKEELIEEKISEIDFNCMEEDDNVRYKSLQIKEMMKDELYPNSKYGKYKLDANGAITGVVSTSPYETYKGLFEPATIYTQFPQIKYRYQDFAYAKAQSSAMMGNYYPQFFLNMSVEYFIDHFDDSYAEAFLDFHPEYCVYTAVAYDAVEAYDEVRPIEEVLQGIQSFAIADALGFYLQSSSTPLTDLATNHDPLPFYHSTNISVNDMIHIKVFYPPPPSGGSGTWADVRIDRMAFNKTFCTGTVDCTNEVMGWTEEQIKNDVLNATEEKQDEFIQELIMLYIANRRERIEKLKYTLSTPSSCTPATGAMTSSEIIDERVLELMYTSASNGTLPNYLNYTNPSPDKDLLDPANFYTGSAYAKRNAILQNYHGQGTATDINGYEKYADEIVKKLSNCRDPYGNYNSGGSLKTALIDYMENNSGVTWKGGITPTSLKGILQTAGYNLDDLCNPYIINYVHTPTDIARDFDCYESSYYDDLADFLYNHNSDIQNAVSNSGANSGALSSAINLTSFNQNNSFENDLITTLLGSFSSNPSNVYMKAINGYQNSNSFTLYFYYTGSSNNIPFSISNSVGITLNIGDDLSMWTNSTTYPRTYVDVQDFKYCRETHPGIYYCQYMRFYSSSELSNRVTCIGPSDKDDLLKIQAFLVVNPDSPHITHTATGYIKGLKPAGHYDQDQNMCITCLEFKDAFDKQSSSLASFREDVMDEYDITGVGHPYFETALTSYMNFNFIKGHTATEYLDFMKSCDLAGEYEIPELYSYLHASSTDTDELNIVYNTVKNFSSGKYPDFNHFYYFKTTGSTITEGNLYINFNDFEKKDLRNIKNAINSSVGTASLTYNDLEKNLRSNSSTFTDLFVSYIENATDGPDHCANGPADADKNWVPKYNAFINCSTGTSPISFTSEVVTVRHGGMLVPYRHFHLEFVNTPTVDEISKYTYIYNTEVLPDDSRSFLSFNQYHTTGTYENLYDEAKIDYLKYTYSRTVPENHKEKTELIRDLQPDRLKMNINGTSPYTADYDDYFYVNYFDKWKGIMSGDLFVKKAPPQTSNGIEDIKGWIEDMRDDISGTGGDQYFDDGADLTASGVKIKMKFLPNNIVWYNIDDNGTAKNIWLKFPDYLPYAGYTIESYQVNLDSTQIVSSTTQSGTFRIKVFKSNTDNNLPANKHFPEVWVQGRADFPLPDYNIYRNVLLCGDAIAEENDDFFLCYEDKIKQAKQEAEIQFNLDIEAAKAEYRTKLVTHIQNNITDALSMKTPQASYMITLYGYDRAGNLAYTVPPAGVNPIWGENSSSTDATDNAAKKTILETYRGPNSTTLTTNDLQSVVPKHHKETKYAYNASNELIVQSTPDGGETKFYYDITGKLICSQNAQQETDNKCAYTLYDNQNRIIETGLIPTTGNFAPVWTKLQANNYPGPGEFEQTVQKSNRTEVIHTFYDEEILDLSTKTGMSRQEFLRNRPATIARYHSLGIPAPANNYAIAIHYSYDVSGNVKTLTYDMPMLSDIKQSYKRVDYNYDLYSGKVTLVSYNRSFADQFYQRYTYDADNRIKEVETSKDGLLWDNDARYEYYPHGPLASIGLGDLAVQKLDFVYTLQGWLKSINGDTPHPDKDYGGDEASNNGTAYQEDLLRSTLYYFEDDYKALDPTDYSTNQDPITSLPDIAASQSLYNGNIAAMLSIPGYFPALYSSYTYDQLNRIKAANCKFPDYTESDPQDVLKAFSDNTFWDGTLFTNQSGSADDVFKTSFTYDKDGNIRTLKRHGLYSPNGKYDYSLGESYLMDDLEYDYDEGTNYKTNKLLNYTDVANHGNTNFTNDLIHHTTTTARFSYDAIGNMTQDMSNTLNSIQWNMYGKVTKVFDAGNSAETEFTYDPLNNRFSKTIYTNSRKKRLTEYYIRDAAGNLLSIYRQKKEYDVSKPVKDILTGYSSVSTTVLAGDIGGVFGTDHSFRRQIVKKLIDAQPTLANSMAVEKDVSFYIGASEELKKAMVSQTDDIVNDLLANNASVVKAPLYAGWDELFFAPILNDTTDSTRLILMAMLVDSTDTTTIGGIVDSLYPGANLPKANGNDLAQVLDFARTDKAHSEIHGVLAHFITGTKLEDAVDRLLADNHFMNASFMMGDYTTVPAYLHDVVKDKASLSALQTYYDARTDGQEILAGVAPLEDQLQLVYDDDVTGFLETVIDLSDGREIVGDALEAMGGMDAERVVSELLSNTPNSSANADYGSTNLALAVVYSKTWLAEQVMYGSSRLGVVGYWPTQYSFEWNASLTPVQNNNLLLASPFQYRRPWYFRDYNNIIKANETEPWGQENGAMVSANRVLGLKRYELSNHLGNVMTVVTDKLTEEKEDAQQSVPTPAIKRATVAAAYDYYPFGSLMPERFEQDETDQCTPVTRSMMVKKWVPIWELPISNSGAELFDGGIGTTIGYVGASQEIEITADAMSTPEAACTLPDGDPAVGKKYSISILAGKNGGGPPATIEVIQDDGNGDQVLAQTTIELSESVTMEVTSVGTADPRIRMVSGDVGATIRVKFVTYKEIDYMLEDVVTLECNNDDFDKDYRFGFNGQQKENNLKGIGNHNTAMFWEYDTRLGRRWNLDPVVFPSESPYAAFRNSPIFYNDIFGDCPDCPKKANNMDIHKDDNGQNWMYDNGSWIGSGEETVISARMSGDANTPEFLPARPLAGSGSSGNILDKATDYGLNVVPIPGKDYVDVMQSGIKSHKTGKISDGPGLIEAGGNVIGAMYNPAIGVGVGALVDGMNRLNQRNLENIDIMQGNLVRTANSYDEFASFANRNNASRQQNDPRNIIIIYTAIGSFAPGEAFNLGGKQPATTTNYARTTAELNNNAYGNFRPTFAVWGYQQSLTSGGFTVEGVVPIK